MALFLLAVLSGTILGQTTSDDNRSSQSWQALIDGLPSQHERPFPEPLVLGSMPLMSNLTNLEIAAIHGTTSIWGKGSNPFGLTGNGVKVAVAESGSIRASHVEFGGQLSGRVINLGNKAMSSHTTAMGGMIGAEGIDPNATGMAVEATLIHHTWGLDPDSLLHHRVWITNNSYGHKVGWTGSSYRGLPIWGGDLSVSEVEEYRFGRYDGLASLYDDLLLKAPYHTLVKSVGNSTGGGPEPGSEHYIINANGQLELSTGLRQVNGGAEGYDTILPDHSAAKNALVVGATTVDASGNVVVTDYSSVGPVDDGRIKPDLVAQAHGGRTPSGASDTSYGSPSGTSLAAAVVSGNLALLYQFIDDHYASPLRASSIKAIATHTAKDIEAAGPDYRAGFGLLDIQAAVNLAYANVDFPGHHISETPLPEGAIITRQVSSFGGDPLKVTIAWSDAKGVAGPIALDDPHRALVNDVDVRVTGPDGREHFPYVLDRHNPWALATTGDNVVDNIEQLLIPNPMPGPYTIRVSAKAPTVGVPVVSMVVTGNIPNTGLPIELSMLEARVDESDVHVTWETTSEWDVASFSIQMQSRMEGLFQTVAEQEPQGGVQQTTSYSELIADLPVGRHAFRLAVQNLDGSIDYSDSIEATVEPDGAFSMDAPFPNPSHGLVTLTLVSTRDERVTMTVYDLLGRVVTANDAIELQANQSESIRLDTSGLASGMYLVKARSGGQEITRRLSVAR